MFSHTHTLHLFLSHSRSHPLSFSLSLSLISHSLLALLSHHPAAEDTVAFGHRRGRSTRIFVRSLIIGDTGRCARAWGAPGYRCRRALLPVWVCASTVRSWVGRQWLQSGIWSISSISSIWQMMVSDAAHLIPTLPCCVAGGQGRGLRHSVFCAQVFCAQAPRALSRRRGKGAAKEPQRQREFSLPPRTHPHI
jgi:hypothetical protein